MEPGPGPLGASVSKKPARHRSGDGGSGGRGDGGQLVEGKGYMMSLKSKMTYSWFFNDIADGDWRNIAARFFHGDNSRDKNPLAYYHRTIVSRLFLALYIARYTAEERSSELF